MTDILFVFDSNKNLIDYLCNNGASPDAPLFDDIYVQELSNGAESFTFSTLSNDRTNRMIDYGNFIVFLHDGKHKMFEIIDIKDTHKDGKKAVTCYCEMIGLELRRDYVEPFEIEGNAILFFKTVLQDTNWQLGNYSNNLLTNIQKVAITEDANVYQIINDNLDTYGNIEIEYRVEFSGNILLGKYIDVYENEGRGSRILKRFEHGENIKGLTRQGDIYSLATAGIGRGKNNITFKEIEWSIEKGDPANKQKGQNFVAHTEANDKYNKGGKYIKSLYKFDDIEDPATLLKHTWNSLLQDIDPKVKYDTDLALTSVEYENIMIGDTNYIIDNDYDPPVLLECRVSTLELSLSDNTKHKCIFSNYKEVKSKIREVKDGQ
ncbi:phage tail spike protein, partial [Clostridium sp.]|uniref:phage tail spike protein n=1 Tax=Clostridium sp. TaxID=1506 RepID=UPI002FC77398